MKKIGRKKANKTFILFNVLLIVLLSITIGFSALSTSLSINGTTAFNPVGLIRVSEFKNGILSDADLRSRIFDSESTTMNVKLNNTSSYATFNVTITNYGQIDYVLSEIIEEVNTNNEDIEYVFDIDPIDQVIRHGESLTFTITIRYKNGVTPQADTKNLKLRYVFDEYAIPPAKKYAYFMAYDGDTDGLFGYTKSSITSFSRNTSLTLEQVRAKSGVTTISNTIDDGYLSEYDVYGWVENNKFYWWSEADEVYFHPQTLRAFNYCDAITSIDLTDTSTEKVENFANWFDKDRKLKTITGKIVTTGLKLQYSDTFDYENETADDPSSGYGLAFMFNDCNALTSIDLSGFVTTNASDMKRMFAGCSSLTSIDVSNFDTSNVRSMHWMFRKTKVLTSADLSSFDTSNVVNFWGMFEESSNNKTIILGDNFDVSNAKYVSRMFANSSKLQTIYAKHDFVFKQGYVGTNMFYNTPKLVGEAGSDYETVWTSSNVGPAFAKITGENKPGYFSYDDGSIPYEIAYNLNGGTAVNKTFYKQSTPTFTLNNPTKIGYTFDGWTGTGLSDITKTVTIPTGSTGARSYTAHYTANKYTVTYASNGGVGTMANQEFTYDQSATLLPNAYTKEGYTFAGWNTMADGFGASYSDEQEVSNLGTSGTVILYAKWKKSESTTFPKVFDLVGPCTFNGTSNITGCPAYANTNYINTNVSLYSTENWQKDYEIYFEIDHFSTSEQGSGSQHTLMNSKYEKSSLNWPGLAFRRESGNLMLTQKINGVTASYTISPTGVSSVRIIRRDKKVYYSINGSALTLLQDMSNFNQQFTTPVTFGSSLDENGNPMRHITGTLSNMYIRLGTYDDEA